MAEGANRLREPAHAQAEHTIGQAVDDAVAKAVANGQPGGDKREGGAIQHMGAFQQEVDDVGQPQHIENTCDAEEHHGVASVRSVPSVMPATTALSSLHLLAGETRPPFTDLAVVLLADAEDVIIGKTDHQRSRCVEQAHHKPREEGGGGPGMGTPLEDVPMVAWLAPPKERWQEDKAGVDPDEGDAAAKPARCHQLVVGQWFGYGQVAVHTDASQAGHRNTLENRDDVAKHLAGDRLLDACRVVEQRQGGYQTAETHQEVGIGHGLDEVAGCVVVKQRGTVEHKDDRQVSSNNEHCQKHDDGRLQDTGLQALVLAPAQRTGVVGGPAREDVTQATVGSGHRVRCQFRLVHCLGCYPGGSGLWRATHKADGL